MVVCQRGLSVYVHTRGDLKKIASCHVKLFKLVDRNEESAIVSKNVMLEDGLQDVKNLFTDLKNDGVGASHLRTAQYVSFSEMCTYIVELPISEHWRPEVKIAKKAEIRNLQDYETFKKVKDKGQNRVGSRRIITKKEQHDGQKTKCKARLVARGFQESVKRQSDSPTAAKESLKLLTALSANSYFKLVSVDICAAFFQSKVLDREVFVEPPLDVKKQGIIWKLMKPLYGLDDASRKFCLRVKDVFLNKLGLKTVEGDKSFYF